jgi:hypothetical protein
MTSLIRPSNANRTFEHGLTVQFFDKCKQITDEDGETIDILDSEGNKIYVFYVICYKTNNYTN